MGSLLGFRQGEQAFFDPANLQVGESCHCYQGGWLVFQQPIERRIFQDPSDIVRQLKRAESWTQEGRFVVLALNYEAGCAFDPALSVLGNAELGSISFFELAPAWYQGLRYAEQVDRVIVDPIWSFEEYRKAFSEVKSALERGDCYQANLTFPCRAALGDPVRFFTSRTGSAPAPYAKILREEEGWILSFSPELFLSQAGNQVRMSPMKGTRDPKQAGELAVSEKDRAENLMIVDMVRNDLGRIARPGSVSVSALFDLEDHGTVAQMTSTVRIETDANLTELLAASFPPASVTGAPKVAATRLLAKIEAGPRGVYTGALGWAGPGRTAQFSVAIRTATVDEKGDGVYGIGSGVVWDSDARKEYEECILKSQVLVQPPRPLRPITTANWEDLQAPDRLAVHLQRLEKASGEMGLPWEPEALITELGRFCPMPGQGMRTSVEYDPLCPRVVQGVSIHEKPKLRARPVEVDPRLLPRQKVNERSFYNDLLHHHSDVDELLLIAPDGELLEFCTGAVIFEDLHGNRFVPPIGRWGIESLAAFRLLKDGAAEQRVTFRDEIHAGKIYLINAVGGPTLIELVD